MSACLCLLIIVCCSIQVDLFFYREVEENKDQEEEEVAPVTDFGQIEYGGGAMTALQSSDQWASLTSADQWNTEPAAAPAPVADWTAAAVPGKNLLCFEYYLVIKDWFHIRNSWLLMINIYSIHFAHIYMI